MCPKVEFHYQFITKIFKVTETRQLIHSFIQLNDNYISVSQSLVIEQIIASVHGADGKLVEKGKLCLPTILMKGDKEFLLMIV